MAVNIDALGRNSDWIRWRWPYPSYKSKAFMDMLKNKLGMSLAQFKKLPVYEMAVEGGLIANDKWVGGK